jgi:hypothetical protein
MKERKERKRVTNMERENEIELPVPIDQYA